MINIKYSPAAIKDLEQIGDYIFEELKNPTAAVNTINRIQHSIDRLSEAPHIGAPLFHYYEHTGNYRFLVSGNYLVFYRERVTEVYIDRTLYKKRDYLTILLGDNIDEQI